uniref:Uncharacterized protein n=1 Tax=Human herpesvirus 1 TaxID=10298 RepID=A0A2U9A812_HHV1|nr:hypothetical protein [Human alphaherpesvirus 1]
MTHVLQEGMCPTPPVFLCLALYAWVLLPGGGGSAGEGGCGRKCTARVYPP